MVGKANEIKGAAIMDGVANPSSKQDGLKVSEALGQAINASDENNAKLKSLQHSVTIMFGKPDEPKANMQAVIQQMQSIFKEINKNNQTIKQGLSQVQRGIQAMGIDTSDNVKPSDVVNRSRGPK